jgi:hypothetical protein
VPKGRIRRIADRIVVERGIVGCVGIQRRQGGAEVLIRAGAQGFERELRIEPAAADAGWRSRLLGELVEAAQHRKSEPVVGIAPLARQHAVAVEIVDRSFDRIFEQPIGEPLAGVEPRGVAGRSEQGVGAEVFIDRVAMLADGAASGGDQAGFGQRLTEAHLQLRRERCVVARSEVDGIWFVG